MKMRVGALWIVAAAACGDSPYQPNPEALVGEFTGGASSGVGPYELRLTVDEVSDSLRGAWSLSFVTSCSTHDGPFSGTLSGDLLTVHLRPDQPEEATFDLSFRVLPGDSVLNGQITAFVPGTTSICLGMFEPLKLHRLPVP